MKKAYKCEYCDEPVALASSLGGFLCKRHGDIHKEVLMGWPFDRALNVEDWYPLVMMAAVAEEANGQ